MFERFADEARRAVVLAQEEARGLRHGYIGTEHLLLGVLHTDSGTAATMLRSMGVTSDDVREHVVEIVGVGDHEPTGNIPFTPRAKKVLELSLRESLHHGQREITDAHIVLAVLREGGGLAAQVLAQMHVDEAAVRAAVVESSGQTEREPMRGRRRLFRRSAPEPSPHEGLGVDEPASVWEYVDDSGWEALSRARATARRRRAATIHCTDLLAGVAGVAGPGVDVLRATSVDPDALVRAAAAPAGDAADQPDALPLDAVAGAALTWAVEQATRLGDPAVTTAHLLGGLLFAVDDELAGLLTSQGVDVLAVHAQLTRHLRES